MLRIIFSTHPATPEYARRRKIVLFEQSQEPPLWELRDYECINFFNFAVSFQEYVEEEKKGGPDMAKQVVQNAIKYRRNAQPF